MFKLMIKSAVISILLLLNLLPSGCGTVSSASETMTQSVSTAADPTSTYLLPSESASEITVATVTTTTKTPVPTNAGAMPYTNWTTTALGTIQWNTPVPAAIAFDSNQKLTITIPEGSTLVDICKLLEKKGIQTFYHTFTAALNNDYPDHAFLSAAKSDARRRYILEGYLFPDTYQFYVGEKPYDIFAKFLNRTEQVLSSYAPTPDLTLDQVITMASLIEEEASGSSRANVSSVLHNRLATGKLLELDKTINYVEWYVKPLIVAATSAEINAYNGFYNTYKTSCPGLPAGPITNPGRLAIEAAISPALTSYLFFVTDTNGTYYFAATYEEHQANLVMLGLS